jgi:hypothetical protein
MSGRGLIIPEPLLGKAIGEETLTNILAAHGKLGRQGDVRVQSRQRHVVQRLGTRMQTIKLVCPAADDHDLPQPRLDRDD